jgi:peptide/nickel transport system permease protein
VHYSAWRRLGSDRIALYGLGIWIGLMVLAIVAPLLPLPSYEDMNLERPLSLPSTRHWLGTDSFGRDTLSRVVYGARVSMGVATVAVGVAVVVGTLAGLTVGYHRGLVDTAISRLMDGVMSFPPVLLAIALVGALGPSARNVAIALAIVYVPRFTRVTRASVLGVAELEYVQAAHALGAGAAAIMFGHILPNVAGPIIVQATASYAYAIIAEAGMSFLGLGTQPPMPSWGSMLADARRYLETDAWYAAIPCVVLSTSVVSITLVGDRLRHALDPGQR